MPKTYADAGVDISEEEKAIKALSKEIKYRRRDFSPLLVGHYAGLIDLGEFALAITTDGVGSKVIIAREMGKFDTIGIDCIAMNVNDLLAVGAEPISFVDYLAMESPDEEITAQIGKGLSKGAEIANISIVGGETATLPEIIRGLDLAGTAIGIVKKDRIITGEKIEIGDVILGLESSGIHSNGLTLARKVIESRGYSYFDPFPPDPERTIGEELLTPTKMYIEILDLLKSCEVHGMAHITGGGFLKLKRISNLGFDIYDPIEPNPIFKFIEEEGEIGRAEMYRTFNMGMGFAIILPESEVKTAEKIVGGKVVGEIVERGIRIGGMEI
ncbi:MAG: phosphoribosylformylglycinamidine cyclo-ligase [Candidatus Syntropharchaeia archaeon]